MVAANLAAGFEDVPPGTVVNIAGGSHAVMADVIELVGELAGAPVDLEVKGRKVHVPAASMGVARFSFAELCAQPLGANDFLHIAHAFHTVLIERKEDIWPSFKAFLAKDRIKE